MARYAIIATHEGIFAVGPVEGEARVIGYAEGDDEESSLQAWENRDTEVAKIFAGNARLDSRQ